MKLNLCVLEDDNEIQRALDFYLKIYVARNVFLEQGNLKLRTIEKCKIP